MTGIGAKPNEPSQRRSREQGLGLETVRIRTNRGLLVANDDDNDGHNEG